MIITLPSHNAHTKRDDELIQVEKRNFFCLFCLDLEAQLIHTNLAQLIEVFKSLTTAQVKGQTEVRNQLVLVLPVNCY